MIWNNIQDCKASIEINVRCLLADINMVQSELNSDIEAIGTVGELANLRLDAIKEILSNLGEYSVAYNPKIDMKPFKDYVLSAKTKIYDQLDLLKKSFFKIKDRKGIYHNIEEKLTREIYYLSEKIIAVYKHTSFKVDYRFSIVTKEDNMQQGIKDFIYIASCQRCKIYFETVRAKNWFKEQLELAGITINSEDDKNKLEISTAPFEF